MEYPLRGRWERGDYFLSGKGGFLVGWVQGGYSLSGIRGSLRIFFLFLTFFFSACLFASEGYKNHL